MSILTDVDTALYQRLTSTGGTALWNQRVYAHQAPQGTPSPYVIFFHVVGGDLNLSPSRLIDMRYQVEVWAETLAEARQGADYLETALHNAALTVSGWNLIGCEQEDAISSVENDKGTQCFRRGSDYRIRMSK